MAPYIARRRIHSIERRYGGDRSAYVCYLPGTLSESLLARPLNRISRSGQVGNPCGSLWSNRAPPRSWGMACAAFFTAAQGCWPSASTGICAINIPRKQTTISADRLAIDTAENPEQEEFLEQGGWSDETFDRRSVL